MTVLSVQPVPGKRSQSIVTHDDRQKEIRCFSPANPQWIINPDGSMDPISLGVRQDVLTNQGDSVIQAKNINTVGIIKGDPSTSEHDGYKFVGIRPDNIQDGSKQLEFTMVDAILDGVKTKIDLSKCEMTDAITTDLGSMVIWSNRQGMRHLFKAENVKNDFALKYYLDIPGFSIANKQEMRDDVLRTPSFTINNKGKYKLDSSFAEWLGRYDNQEYSKKKNHIDFSMPNFKLMVLPREEQWPDTDKWNIDPANVPKDFLAVGGKTATCEAHILEDTFFCVINKPDVDWRDLRDLLVESLSRMTGEDVQASILTQDDHWHYTLLINGEYAGLVIYDVMSDRLFINIPTKDLELLYGHLFRRTEKLVTSPSVLGLTYDDLYTHFVDDFIPSIEMTFSGIPVRGEYFIPDERGAFQIVDESGVRFTIGKPKLLDENFNILHEKTVSRLDIPGASTYDKTIYADTFHTLRHVVGDTYEYIKYSGHLSTVHGILDECFYIDAEIVYGETGDGVLKLTNWGSLINTWPDPVDGTVTSASSVVTNELLNNQAIYTDVDSESGKISYDDYDVHRSAFYFDTSGISGTVNSAILYVKESSTQDHTLYVNLGTFSGALATSDWVEFSTGYGDMTRSGGWHSRAITAGDINTSGNTNFMVRDTLHDESQTVPSSEKQTGLYFADTTGTASDPYLSIGLLSVAVASQAIMIGI